MLAGFVLAQIVLRHRSRSPRSVLLMVGFLGLAVADANFIADLGTDAYTSSLGVAALWGASFAVITEAATGEILGAHIIGADATELIAEYGLAMATGASAQQIHHTIHAHPTLSEAIMEAAAAAGGAAIHI